MLQYTDITCHEIGQKYKSYKKNYVLCCIFFRLYCHFLCLSALFGATGVPLIRFAAANQAAAK